RRRRRLGLCRGTGGRRRRTGAASVGAPVAIRRIRARCTNVAFGRPFCVYCSTSERRIVDDIARREVGHMPRKWTSLPILRWVVSGAGLLLIAYLAVVALRPSIIDALPSWLGWFGRPGSMPTLGIVVTVLIAAGVLTFRSDSSHRLVGVSFTVIAAMILMSAALGLSSYWGCHDANHPAFFTPLMATAQLVKGSTGDFSVGGHTCPNPTPVGLQLARITALAAIFTGLGGVVVGVFRSQVDRFRANLAESVTAIVGIDDDTQSIISGVARTLDRRSTLVVITSAGDDRVQRARRQGARVVLVDFNTPSTLVSLRLWRHLSRLYLMA